MWWPSSQAVPPDERQSFVTWANARRAPAGDVDYPSRALVGRYLSQGFSTLCRHLPPAVRLNLRSVAVDEARRCRRGWTLRAGDSCSSYDEVLVAVGHQGSSDSGLAAGWAHAAPLVPAVFPVERRLDRRERRAGRDGRDPRLRSHVHRCRPRPHGRTWRIVRARRSSVPAALRAGAGRRPPDPAVHAQRAADAGQAGWRHRSTGAIWRSRASPSSAARGSRPSAAWSISTRTCCRSWRRRPARTSSRQWASGPEGASEWRRGGGSPRPPAALPTGTPAILRRRSSSLWRWPPDTCRRICPGRWGTPGGRSTRRSSHDSAGTASPAATGRRSCAWQRRWSACRSGLPRSTSPSCWP